MSLLDASQPFGKKVEICISLTTRTGEWGSPKRRSALGAYSQTTRELLVIF